MPARPIGKKSKNLTINLPVNLFEDLKDLADESDLPVGTYIRHILEDANRVKPIFKTTTVKVIKGEDSDSEDGEEKHLKNPGEEEAG